MQFSWHTETHIDSDKSLGSQMAQTPEILVGTIECKMFQNV